jgi:esterase/lipase superfamily enzyme
VKKDKDVRLVDLLFATDRNQEPGNDLADFGSSRADSLTFGVVRVRVPNDHKIGTIELPSSQQFFGVTLWRESADPS